MVLESVRERLIFSLNKAVIVNLAGNPVLEGGEEREDGHRPFLAVT